LGPPGGVLETLRFWFVNTRPHSMTQSLMPGLLAVTLAAGREGFSPLLALLAVAGVELAHLGINLLDDYFDYRHQNSLYRDLMAREGMRARIAKCPYLTGGRATIGQLWAACVIFCSLAILCGIPILVSRGAPVLWLAGITAALGLTYSGRPLRLSYRGLGEIVIGVVFGPLLMSGVYLAACGELDPGLWLVSIPVGLLVMNIVYAHAIMDVEPDKRVGKRTLAVLAGGPKARLAILALALTIPYVLIGAGVAAGRLAPPYLAALATLPMAAALFKLMREFAVDPAKPLVRRAWMGPMSRWESVKANGIEWFMVRWYLARNLLLFFCLCVMVGGIIAGVAR
jgi:1,4-dihydroxy-2-naphthoate octaprenyltransferase